MNNLYSSACDNHAHVQLYVLWTALCLHSTVVSHTVQKTMIYNKQTYSRKKHFYTKIYTSVSRIAELSNTLSRAACSPTLSFGSNFSKCSSRSEVSSAPTRPRALQWQSHSLRYYGGSFLACLHHRHRPNGSTVLDGPRAE